MQESLDISASSAPHTIELDALLREYELGLVLIAGAGADTQKRPVQWVHSSDLDDPTPFLTPRTVLLTTGAQFGEALEADAANEYAQRIAGSGATALGVAIGVQWERIPPALIAACEQARLPLFRVPYDTPFLAVVRTAARLLDAESRGIEGWGREQIVPPSAHGRRQRVAAAELALRGAVLQLLVEGQHDLAERVAAPVLPALPHGAIAVVHFETPSNARTPVELASLLTETPGLLAAGDAASTTAIVETGHLTDVRRMLAKHSIAAGVSERGSLGDLTDLVVQARRASELALRRGESAPLAYRPDMHAGVLRLLRESPEAVRRARGLLAPLRLHDERHGDTLEASLYAWLRHNGQTSRAATELGLHRHTLTSRVQASAELLGRDLDSPDDRAELWAALTLTPARGR